MKLSFKVGDKYEDIQLWIIISKGLLAEKKSHIETIHVHANPMIFGEQEKRHLLRFYWVFLQLRLDSGFHETICTSKTFLRSDHVKDPPFYHLTTNLCNIFRNSSVFVQLHVNTWFKDILLSKSTSNKI